jgi:hypothetical protein
MRSCLAFMSVAVVSAALLFGALPASAKPSDSQDNFTTDLERLAATLGAQSARALHAASDVAARAVHDGKEALAEAETDAGHSFQEFRETLNERKARLGMIGEDAAARLKAWKQETFAAWLDAWPETWSEAWSETMSEMHRSATEALDWFRDWIGKQSASDQQTEIPV